MISFRLASIDDAMRIWEWRNDELTRKASLNSKVIEWDEHLNWFTRAINSSDRRIYVAIHDGKEFGSIRMDIIGKDLVELSWMIAPHCRGLGLGKIMLADFCRDLGASAVAHIKLDNIPSEKVALEAGFKREACNGDYALWKRTLPSEIL